MPPRPPPEAGQIIAETYERHGTAFAVYLTLNGVDAYNRSHRPEPEPQPPANHPEEQVQIRSDAPPPLVETDFTNAYYGCFPDREAIIEDTIATFDFAADLRHLLRERPDLEMVVALNREAIWDLVADQFEIIDSGDALYVFERWP